MDDPKATHQQSKMEDKAAAQPPEAQEAEFSTPRRAIRYKPQTPDHPELFIQKKPTPVRTPSSIKKDRSTRLAGVYPPNQIFNPTTELNESKSRAENESEESLNAKMNAMVPEITEAFKSVVELVMWHDKPTLETQVTRSFLRRRVANQLALPSDCFDRDSWRKKSKFLIQAEVVSVSLFPFRNYLLILLGRTEFKTSGTEELEGEPVSELSLQAIRHRSTKTNEEKNPCYIEGICQLGIKES